MHINKKHLFTPSLTFFPLFLSFSFCSRHWVGSKQKQATQIFYCILCMFLLSLSDMEKGGQIRPKATLWIMA